MMKYFLDTEFNECAGERPTIDLISIGIACEDGRTFYAESADFDESACNPWVKKNVLPKLGPWNTRRDRESIAHEIVRFVNEPLIGERGRLNPEFWAYYADYDWVVFCWLFGAMVDLPAGFPMICMDLQQWWLQLGQPDIKPPTPIHEHNALVDACWNQELYHKLMAEQNERNRR